MGFSSLNFNSSWNGKSAFFFFLCGLASFPVPLLSWCIGSSLTLSQSMSFDVHQLHVQSFSSVQIQPGDLYGAALSCFSSFLFRKGSSLTCSSSFLFRKGLSSSSISSSEFSRGSLCCLFVQYLHLHLQSLACLM